MRLNKCILADFVPDVKMGFHSKQVTCPICHEETATYVWYQPGRLANVVFAVTCLTGQVY